MSECPSQAELFAFSVGDCSQVALHSISGHVSACPNCAATLAGIDDDADLLIAQLREPPGAEVMTDHECNRAVALAERVGLEAVRSLASSLPERREGVGSTDGPHIGDADSLGNAQPGSDQSAGRSVLVPIRTRCIGHYEILQQIGRGGMGSVYKARHTHLDKLVAIKVLNLDRLDRPDATPRFLREMRAGGNLNHPNIVQATDAGEADGVHFLVMELIVGIDLSRLVQRVGPIPVPDACEIIRQAAVGLHHAHQHGMVHRDIKPSNLMLARSCSPDGSVSGTVKILDLGLARLRAGHLPADELTSTGQVLGTIDYMAPEQASGTHNVDLRADIYSLGCTLYKLLTSDPPYHGPLLNTPLKKAMAHAQAPIPHIRNRTDVPVELTEILHRMLAKHPAGRFESAADLARALEPFAQGCNVAGLLDEKQAAPRNVRPTGQPAHPEPVLPGPQTQTEGVTELRRRDVPLHLRVSWSPWVVRLLATGIILIATWTALFWQPWTSKSGTSNQDTHAGRGVAGWVMRDGQGGPNPDDGGFAIVTDEAGNVYVAGSLFFEGDSGTNPGNADIFVAKYSPTGESLWRIQLGGPGDDRAKGIATDSAGNLFVTGSFQGNVDFDPDRNHEAMQTSAGHLDAFVMKLNASGQLLWAKRFGQAGAAWNIATGVAVSSENSVYVTGSFADTVDFDPGPSVTKLKSAGKTDSFVLKLDGGGAFVWVVRMGGAGDDVSMDVAADTDGNVFVTGKFEGTADFDPDPYATVDRTSRGSADAFIVKLNSAGSLVWTSQLGGTGYEQGTGVVVDADGNIFAAGMFQSTADLDGDSAERLASDGLFDVYVMSLDAAGVLRWRRQIGTKGDDRPRRLALDHNGGLYISGYFSTTADFDRTTSHAAETDTRTSVGGRDGFILKLDSSGGFQWVRTMGGPEHDETRAVAIDRTGNVYATGFFQGTSRWDTAAGPLERTSISGKDIFILKLMQ